MAYLHCADIPIDTYIQGLTSSYAGKSNETLVVASSVLTFALAAILLGLSLFSHVAILSSVHHAHLRLLLTAAISLFVPVMSYLFSEAEKETDCMVEGLDLTLRAQVILTWMLLMEVLRRKVEAVNIVAEGPQRYIGIITNGGQVVWLGYLVFTNVKGAGRVAVFGFLWIICATKWLRRLVFAKVKRRSLAYDKNPRLISSYMDQMLLQLRQDVPVTGPEKLKSCDYVVMGEEKLVSEAGGPWGYLLHGLSKVPSVVTVGQVWRVADVEVEEGDHRPLLRSNPSLKRLCLSMALFKLLRRRVERLSAAMATEETDHCQDLILQGLLQEDQDGGSNVFEVLNNEVDFLSEYYHSVHPVVLASPYFFAVNYLVVPAVACLLSLTTVFISSSGHLKFEFRSIPDAIPYGNLKLPLCLLQKAVTSREALFPAFFAAIDVLISYLLYAAFFLEIAIEFVVFLLSNWFMVSLLRSHVAKKQWRHRSVFPVAIRFISWARRRLRHPSIITTKQFSVLTTRSPPAARLPSEAKRSIVKRFRLAAYGHDNLGTVPLSKGSRALEMPDRQQFSWFCNSDSVAEVILTWHIATSLLEMKHPHHRKRMGRPEPDIVATRLSNYCAHLVASHPELLPGHQEGTRRVLSKMKKDLMKGLGIWVYFFSSRRARYSKMMMLTPDKLRAHSRDDSLTVLQRGIVLGKALVEATKQQGNDQPVWELLADVWVELIVYVSPSSGEEHIKGHQEALMHGCELVTLLWALAMHTGITRPPRTAVPVDIVENGIYPA